MEIAVISGKGGSGKSSIAAALATAAGRLVLADCDVDAANQYLLFNPLHREEEIYISGYKARIMADRCLSCGICHQHCRFGAVMTSGPDYIVDPLKCEGCRLCAHLCPEQAITMDPANRSRLFTGDFRYGTLVYGRLAPGEENSGKLVSLVREKAKAESLRNKLPLIILDGPPGTGCPVISTITGVDQVVVVTEASLSGLADFRRVMKVVNSTKSRVSVIINKADLNTMADREIETECLENNWLLLGRIPFDASFTHAMVAGKSIPEFLPESGLSKKLLNMYDQLMKNRHETGKDT